MKSKKTWREKLDTVGDWKIVPADGKRKESMLVPTPRMIELMVQEIPDGAVTTAHLIRKTLARRYGAETTCPLCTGIFLRLTAEAAAEAEAAGEQNVSPYWRVVDQKGKPNAKYPGGIDGQMMLLEDEWLTCLGRGKRTAHQ